MPGIKHKGFRASGGDTSCTWVKLAPWEKEQLPPEVSTCDQGSRHEHLMEIHGGSPRSRDPASYEESHCDTSVINHEMKTCTLCECGLLSAIIHMIFPGDVVFMATQSAAATTASSWAQPHNILGKTFQPCYIRCLGAPQWLLPCRTCVAHNAVGGPPGFL